MRRLELLQDCLAVLSDGEVEDAEAVIKALERMRLNDLIRALWRPCELPATARMNLAEEHSADPAGEKR